MVQSPSVGRLHGPISVMVRSAVKLFYRVRHLDEGAIPRAGPLLLVANHPNGLVDPVLVASAAARPVRMLAKAPLFRTPGISLLVKGLGALPVYRPKDGADTAQNAETFRAVSEALTAGDAVLVFPEGISHDEPQLQKLKTGAARMALSAFDAGARTLRIVPVGLVYRQKERFRSEVATRVGPLLDMQAFVESTRQLDEVARVRALTEAMAEGLARVTLNLEAWEDLPLLDAVDALWRGEDPARAVRLSRLADGVRALRSHAPQALAALRARVEDWTASVHALGLEPRDFSPERALARADASRVLAFVLRQIAAGVFMLPVALAGALFFAVPFWGVDALVRAVRVERDVAATAKLLASLIVFPAWWLGMSLWCARAISPAAAMLLAACAPVCGMTARHFAHRRRRAWRDMRVFFALLKRTPAHAQLDAEAHEILAQVNTLAAQIETRAESVGVATDTR